ncbi:hypothetical protein FAI41_07965 [Acetobacteraceae bacterium]|nr:hypothetical protein FAI41_07965 [Acetobacteraceae bacterium]
MKKRSFLVRSFCGLIFTLSLFCHVLPSVAVPAKPLKLSPQQTEMAGLLATYYRQKGWSEHVVAGIVANIYFECSLDPSQVNTNGASGLAQWLGVRKKNFVKKYGVLPHQAPWKDQADFIQQALTDPTSPYKFVGKELLHSQNAAQATLYFARDYEVPGRNRKEATIVAQNRAKMASQFQVLLKKLGAHPKK